MHMYQNITLKTLDLSNKTEKSGFSYESGRTTSVFVPCSQTRYESLCADKGLQIFLIIIASLSVFSSVHFLKMYFYNSFLIMTKLELFRFGK